MPIFQQVLPHPQATTDPAMSPLRSLATPSFSRILHERSISLLMSTYQTGMVVSIRADSETSLNTHFRRFESPMGLAVNGNEMALGIPRGVWTFTNHTGTLPRLQPPGKHDAVFVPRDLHVTGNIEVHEVGFAGRELWVVNTHFSTLCTIDPHHSFTPQWRPPFITRLAAEDRCHLNGMAIEHDRVAYVTAFGATDTMNGWRDGKIDGGILMDVPAGRIVVRGLTMPHSPRVYGGDLWFLESGRGTLSKVDRATGAAEVIAELPGFTRGLGFSGPYAFVGLSQVRQTNIFGGLPLCDRVQERLCGIWVVDLRDGSVAAFLRFEDRVQEIFDVQVLEGIRWPEIVEPNDALVMTSYLLPEALNNPAPAS